jgi:hypothetical protein
MDQSGPESVIYISAEKKEDKKEAEQNAMFDTTMLPLLLPIQKVPDFNLGIGIYRLYWGS